jgi:hypothetical protein
MSLIFVTRQVYVSINYAYSSSTVEENCIIITTSQIHHTSTHIVTGTYVNRVSLCLFQWQLALSIS